MKLQKNIILLFIFFINCTGLNIGYSIYRTNGTANPIPEYTHPYVIGVYRGGVLAFRDHIPGQLNGMNVNSIKKGESCMSSYFFAYSSGDSSIETAAIKAGITKIKQVNYFVDAIFFGLIKHEFCTIVVGE